MMSVARIFKSAALNTRDKAQGLDSKLRSEVLNGDWNDDVGQSYLAYSNALCRNAESFIAAAYTLERIENSLDSIDEKADRSKLEKTKSAV